MLENRGGNHVERQLLTQVVAEPVEIDRTTRRCGHDEHDSLAQCVVVDTECHRVTNEAGGAWLTAVNEGNRHLTVHDMKIKDETGRVLLLDVRSPPHSLAGASRRWRIVTNTPLARNAPLRLTAGADLGAIDVRILADADP